MRVLLMAFSVALGSLALSGCGSSFKGALNEGPGGGPVPADGQPVVTAVSPASVVAGGPSFTITVTGKNFASGDAVEWNDLALDSTFVSSTQMTAKVPNTLLYEAMPVSIDVQRPVADSLLFGATLNVTAPPAPGTAGFTLSTVTVQANDMVWDPASKQIYLSVAGSDPNYPNTITALDPATAKFGLSVSAGPGADRLGVSSNSSWLYAGIDSNGTIQRFALPGLTSDITIPLGAGPSSKPYYPAGLQTAPGSSNTIAASLFTSLGEVGGVVIYDGAVPRPVALTTDFGPREPLRSLAWNASGTAIYAALNGYYDDTIFALSVNSTGVQLVKRDDLNPGSEAVNLGGVHYSALTGYVYGDEGDVFDPATNSVINHLPENVAQNGFSSGSNLVTIDDSLGTAWVIGSVNFGSNSQVMIEAFDLQTNALLGSIVIPNVPGTPLKLIRWGTNGLAFLTNHADNSLQGYAVYILSGQFVTKPSTQFRRASPRHFGGL